MGSKKRKKYRAATVKGEIQRETGVTAKKQLGQHFLKDLNIAKKIASTLELKGYEYLIEIGPGTGILTRYLLDLPVHLTAIEIDREAAHYLREEFPLEFPNLTDRAYAFEIREADFLKLDLRQLFKGQPFGITGNFPYNISTQILFKMLEYKELIPEFSGMFQKEVAERICAGPGNKIYGILSVLVQAYYDAEYLFTVPPHVFDPPPRVESGVLRLTRKKNFTLEVKDALFFRVVKTGFNQRRKTLRNSLKTFNLSDNLKEDAIFDQRPEQLSVSDFIALSRKIADDTV